MAFEFVARQLRERVDHRRSADRFDDLDNLEGEVGDGRESRPEDVIRVKTAFRRLGRLEEPERGFSGFVDRSLDGAIRSFQREHGLRQDGFMRPGGPTQRALQAQLRRAADGRDEPRHRIDFGFISELEGGQKLQGYVPKDDETRLPFPQSGVTIATGFDLAERTAEELDRMGIPEPIISRLRPYLGVKGVEADELVKRRPLRLTREEAEIVDPLVRRDITDAVIRSFNRASRFRFERLPSAMQTVIASVGFQYGPSFADTPRFFGFATEGDVPGLVAELRDFQDRHANRRNREADYLVRNLPRPKLKPKR